MNKLEKAQKKELVKLLSEHRTATELVYLLGVQHGLQQAYNIGGIDRAHKRQRDAELEERADRRASTRRALTSEERAKRRG